MQKGDKRNEKRLISIFILVLFALEMILLFSSKIELAQYNFQLILVFILFYFLSTNFKVNRKYLFGLVLVGILNFMGGLIFIEGVRLYDSSLGFLKWDLMIHFIGLFFATLITYEILGELLKGKKNLLLAIAIFVAMGFGALFEVSELLGILLLNNQGVGDYFNNAMDLLVNFIGSVVAGIYILIRR